jgi:hypothetical protein
MLRAQMTASGNNEKKKKDGKAQTFEASDV